MATVTLDDEITSGETNGSQKVEEYLQDVISHLPPNRIVTQVVMDGNRYFKSSEEPLNRTLEEVRELQIKTADKAIWAATGLDIAISCVERVKGSLIRVSELFRDGDLAKANRFFAHCIEGLERFLESITITKAAMNLNFNKVPTENGTLAQTEDSLLNILKGILELQERNQMDELADKIECELLTNLVTWNSALKALRNSAHSNC